MTTFEDYIVGLITSRSKLSVSMGLAKDGTSASLMTWSDKDSTTHFWDVSGDTVKLIGKD